jgi:hypothetical protein
MGRRPAVAIVAMIAAAMLAAACGGPAQPAKPAQSAAGNVPAATGHAASPAETLSGLSRSKIGST